MSRSLSGKGSHCAADVMRAYSSFPPCRVDGRKSWSHGVGVTRPRRLRQEGLSPPVPRQDVLPAAAWMLFKEAGWERDRCHPDRQGKGRGWLALGLHSPGNANVGHGHLTSSRKWAVSDRSIRLKALVPSRTSASDSSQAAQFLIFCAQ